MIAKFLRSCLYFGIDRKFIGEPEGGLQLHRTWTLIVLGRAFSFQLMLVAQTWYDDQFC